MSSAKSDILEKQIVHHVSRCVKPTHLPLLPPIPMSMTPNCIPQDMYVRFDRQENRAYGFLSPPTLLYITTTRNVPWELDARCET
jgi:hypothetical protein